jgi:uncharacterized membrane protein
MVQLAALVIGVVSGLRTFTAPAAVSWAARLGWLPLHGTSLAFLGAAATPWVLTLLALGEWVGDQHPKTPSRTVPMQFGARLISGGFCGTAIGMAHGSAVVGLVAGLVGAVIGTLGGRAARGALANSFGSDRPAAFLEDGVAVALALLAIGAFR